MPKQIKIQLKEEFEKHKSFFEHGEYEQYFVDFDSIVSWWLSKLDSLLKQQREEAHETKDGYCCACDYDIACFNNKIEEAKINGRKEGFSKFAETMMKNSIGLLSSRVEEVEAIKKQQREEMIEKIRDLLKTPAYNKDQTYDIAINEVLSLIKEQ